MVNQYIFEFSRVDTFIDDMNREGKFDIYDMDGVTKNYKMVLVSECPSDINDCLDEDGTLDGDKVHRVTTVGEEDGKQDFASFLSLLSLLFSPAHPVVATSPIHDSD